MGADSLGTLFGSASGHGQVIDVLLSTYRPDAALLTAQVDSIRTQRGVEVNLLCREDVEGLGAAQNFSALLSVSHGEYVAFSDQDDVWDEDKLAKSLEKIRELEREFGKEVPLLVFCDGYVVDSELNRMSGTVLSRQRVNIGKGLHFNRLLMQNFVVGNAMFFNAALREKAGAVPPEALMHDAWLILVAAAFGHVGWIDEPLYSYRQHGNNLLGETLSGAKHFLRRAREGLVAFRTRLAANAKEAEAFVERFGPQAPTAARALAILPSCSWWGRRFRVIRHGLYKHGLARNLSLLLFA